VGAARLVGRLRVRSTAYRALSTPDAAFPNRVAQGPSVRTLPRARWRPRRLGPSARSSHAGLRAAGQFRSAERTLVVVMVPMCAVAAPTIRSASGKGCR